MSGSASVVGGGEWLLSGSGKYGSLCHFLTGEGDSLCCFGSQRQSGDHGGQARTQEPAF